MHTNSTIEILGGGVLYLSSVDSSTDGRRIGVVIVIGILLALNVLASPLAHIMCNIIHLLFSQFLVASHFHFL